MGNSIIIKLKHLKMKFAALVATLAVANAQGEEKLSNCKTDAECSPVDGKEQKCATMTMEGFSVDQCVAEILCGETMELEGVKMSYKCKTKYAAKIMASAAALFAVAYTL